MLEGRFACALPRGVDLPPRCDAQDTDACRVHLPDPSEVGHLYGRWRSTSTAEQWGRPALVELLLRTAGEYAYLFPGERLVIGDLDAKGSRHTSHDRGIDADLYLPDTMEADNRGRHRVVDTYADLPELHVRMLRARVETLAQVLTECSGGRVRIYYNDAWLRRRFLTWFESRGLRSPFGRALQGHNETHRYHFHVSLDERVEALEEGWKAAP